MPTLTPSLKFPVPDDGDPSTPDPAGFSHLCPETPYFTPMDQLLPAPTAGDPPGYFTVMKDAAAPHRPLPSVPTGPCAPRTDPLLATFAAYHANGSPSSQNNYRPTVPSLLRRSPGTSATVVTRPPPSHNASCSGVAFPTLTPSNLAHLITINRPGLTRGALRRSSVSSTHGSPTNVLLIDTRPHSQFRYSHIRGAVNICIPSTLLKRATFGVDKVVASLSSSPESQQLVREWDSFTHIVIMDQRSSTMQEQSGVFCLCQKFTQTTSTVHIGWLLGGFDAFARRFPHLCTEPLPKDAKGSSGDSPFHNHRLPAGVRYSEPKTCPIPSVVGNRAVDNPFFLSFRHNNEPTVGPETDARIRPGPQFLQASDPLPEFLARATDKQFGPDYLSRAFEALQNAENERLAQMLQNQGSQAFDFKHSIERHDKNRYYNIIPYDDTRVVLQSPCARDDYINASWLSSKLSSQQYISTQGPIPGTVDDFWAMVWEQQSRVVVMLTREWERNRVTCHRYWPSELDTPMAAGARMIVTLVAQDPFSNDPSIIVRVIRLQHFSSDAQASTSSVHYVAQLQYLGWPDFGVPADPRSVLRLRQLAHLLDEQLAGTSSAPSVDMTDEDTPAPAPLVIHCSAGCGRSGAFCTMDTVLSALGYSPTVPSSSLSTGHGDEGMVLSDSESPAVPKRPDGAQCPAALDRDLVYTVVRQFRHDRVYMVQNLAQFAFCYEGLVWQLAGDFDLAQEQPPLESTVTRVLRQTQADQQRTPAHPRAPTGLPSLAAHAGACRVEPTTRANVGPSSHPAAPDAYGFPLTLPSSASVVTTASSSQDQHGLPAARAVGSPSPDITPGFFRSSQASATGEDDSLQANSKRGEEAPLLLSSATSGARRPVSTLLNHASQPSSATTSSSLLSSSSSSLSSTGATGSGGPLSTKDPLVPPGSLASKASEEGDYFSFSPEQVRRGGRVTLHSHRATSSATIPALSPRSLTPGAHLGQGGRSNGLVGHQARCLHHGLYSAAHPVTPSPLSGTAGVGGSLRGLSPALNSAFLSTPHNSSPVDSIFARNNNISSPLSSPNC